VCGAPTQNTAAVRRLCKGEDVEELDVQTGLGAERAGGRSASPSYGSKPSSRSEHDAIVAALRAAPPYEEPAFDVYQLL
jgi:hypothetical protein